MRATIDGNEAAASVAYRLNEVCCIYPITPSSPMAELADEWSSQHRPNIWGSVPAVVEMQSEGGAAGALHGALQGGALATTFTASQGLLLMIPNMYKIAGELTPAVMHVAARSLAAQGLSIFGDHSDVMAVRQTGFALLASASVQEAHDLALVAQAVTLATRVPFVHFFDGFRTSHELNTIELLDDDDLRALVPAELVRAHRGRALSPEHPFIRGTAQNPDVYFQARETVNPFYAAVPGAVEDAMGLLAERTGRRYHTVEYSGHPEADRVIVVMGSAAETVKQTVAHLCAQGERTGVVQVRLYRPFPDQALLEALPASVRRIAVLDRTKEPGSAGEPLFLDVSAVLAEACATGERAVLPVVTGGRYGLSSKEFTPGMAAGVFAELARERPRPPVHHRDQRRRVRAQPALRPWPGHRAIRHGPRRLLRPGLGRHGRREQEHDQDPRRRGGSARAGLLRLRLEEVRLADRVPPPLRAGADPRALPGRPGRASSAATSSGCWTGSTCSAVRHRARRCCSTARARPARSGTRCPGRSRRRSWPSRSRCTRSTPPGSPARPGWPGGPTPCCKPASSPSPACSPGTRRSRRSSRPSPRPTGAAGPRS